MPTISLMHDQTIQVSEHGIKVAYMGSVTKYQQTIAGADPDLWKGGVKNELRHYIFSGLIR